MNPTSKKFISLFLIFSLMMLSANLYAKERRGAELIITKKDGRQIEGELIVVKRNSLLLLESGIDVVVDIKDMKAIKMIKKSRAVIGFLLGGSLGALIYVVSRERPIYFASGESGYNPEVDALAGGFFGGLIGLVIGMLAGADKTIQIEGMSDLEIKEALEKLRKKARIRDYK